jgi:acyl transferase domain-containing protein
MALLVAYHRGVAASLVHSKSPDLKGLMMAVGIRREALSPYLTSLTRGKVVVGCVNSPTSMTLSGDEAAILELRDIFEAKQISATILRVDTAYHSHHMACVAENYEVALSGLDLCPPGEVKFYSSVTGQLLDWTELTPNYWVKNMLSTVLFSDSVRSLCLDKRGAKSKKGRKAATAVGILVEIGPHSALSGPIRDILKSDINLSASSISYIPSLIRNKDAVKTCQDLAGKLFEKGYEIDFAALNQRASRKSPEVLIDLPPSAWNHTTSYWHEPRVSKTYRNRIYPRTDLLGVEVNNTNPLEPRWRHFLRPAELPWLRDHRVHSNIVFPAAGYCCMAIEAAHQRATEKAVRIRGYTIREFSIGQALVVPEQAGEVEVMLSMRPHNPSIRVVSDIWDEFCVFSVSGPTWTEHCRGLIRVLQLRDASEVDGQRHLMEEKTSVQKNFLEIESHAAEKVDVEDLYARLAGLGLDYGPTFATLTDANTSAGKCVGRVTVSDTAAGMPSKFEYPFVLHPSTLDACLHTVFSAIESNSGKKMQQPLVPTFIEELFVSADIQNGAGWKFLSCADVYKKDARDTFANILVCDELGQRDEAMISARGVVCHDIPPETSLDTKQVTKDLAFKLHYLPDVNFLSQEFWKTYPPLLAPPGERELIQGLERAALYYMERAVNQTDPSMIPKMHDHHRKLFSSFTRSCERQLPEWDQWTETEPKHFIEKIRNSSDEAKILCAVGEKLPEILKKEIDPLTIMLEDDLLHRYYETNSRLTRCTQGALPYLELLAHKNPQMKILEIGAGTGSATLPILRLLGGGGDECNSPYPRFQNYDFTDISGGFFEKSREKLSAWGSLITYRKLDIEKNPVDQGFDVASYDLVIASNVLHATECIAKTLGNVRKLLKPNGKLLMVEFTLNNLITDLLWGTLPGWWVGMDHSGYLREELLC